MPKTETSVHLTQGSCTVDTGTTSFSSSTVSQTKHSNLHNFYPTSLSVAYLGPTRAKTEMLGRPKKTLPTSFLSHFCGIPQFHRRGHQWRLLDCQCSIKIWKLLGTRESQLKPQTVSNKQEILHPRYSSCATTTITSDLNYHHLTMVPGG